MPCKPALLTEKILIHHLKFKTTFSIGKKRPTLKDNTKTEFMQKRLLLIPQVFNAPYHCKDVHRIVAPPTPTKTGHVLRYHRGFLPHVHGMRNMDMECHLTNTSSVYFRCASSKSGNKQNSVDWVLGCYFPLLLVSSL